MSTKIFVAIVAVIVAIILLTMFFTAGDEVKGGEPHKCSTSTNINDLFCREN